MKRRFFWLVAVAGLVWLYLRRGARRPQPVDRVPAPADPAEELRRKLDEAKDGGSDEPASHVAEPEPQTSYPTEPDPHPADVLGVEQPHTDPPEPVEPPAPVVSEELDARRREIHERARSATDEIRGTSSD